MESSDLQVVVDLFESHLFAIDLIISSSCWCACCCWFFNLEKYKKENAQIHWADETGISSVEHYPRGYTPKGKTPVLTLSQAARERVNMISSITNQGRVRFMVYPDKFSAQGFWFLRFSLFFLMHLIL